MSGFIARLTGAVLAMGLAAPALAADLRPAPVRMPAASPVVAPVPFSWTGCYVGLHGGGGWGKKDWYEEGGTEFVASHNVHGWLVGGQLGCNLQAGNWVFGIEGQAAYADIHGSSTLDGMLSRIDSHVDIVGSLAGRLGYAFGATGQTMLYVKGGLGFAQDQHRGLWDGAEDLTSSKYMRWGWMVGAGIEHALDQNWSIKGEYNYMNLGSRDVALCLVPEECLDLRIRQDLHIFKVGVNYRFGGARPVVARY